jgi:glycosidase
VGIEKWPAMHAFNIAVPGIPILYYGDEIALHGGNDPDNRKMMPFDFSPRQQQLFDRIARLNENRTNIMALNYGSTTVTSTRAAPAHHCAQVHGTGGTLLL